MRKDWLSKLTSLIDGNCLWIGDDFNKALRQAKKHDANVYEHDQYRGRFVVNHDKAFTNYPERWSHY